MSIEKKRPFELFSEPKAADAFLDAQTRWLALRQEALQSQLMSPENRLRYSHGREIIHPAHEDPSPNSMELHSTTWQIKFDDIRQNNLVAWAEGLVDLSDGMHQTFMGMMIKTLNASTERSGNIVNAAASGSFATSYFEMMERIEFGVNRNGEVSQPTMLVHPDMAEKLIAELEAQPAEYRMALEELRERKSRDALEREAKRKAQFKAFES